MALVTGAGKGIGAAVAAALAAEGASVGVVDLDEAAARHTVGTIQDAGGRAIALVGDASRAADVRAAVAACVERFGGLDLLASLAGVMRYTPVTADDEDAWDLVLATNLKAPFLCARYAIPEMRRRGGGAIVNVSSVLAFTSQATLSAYSASKGGVLAMTRSIALEEAAAGIRVNCVAPGTVRTPMLEAVAADVTPGDPQATLDQIARANPIGRLIEPAEVAGLVLFLLSKDAGAITGACYQIDGGLLARMPDGTA
ncbi:SDR family NAD(P)-dependent oxidoreductase [Actinomadura mexicana]|uniref:SDR family NAD(P)-dependent oxidoreductase n=1 Tax=Actinomadura mexicana TaxID=134959 RepID=UPI0015C5F14D|nr:SDR family NAD(P)-dependent oxidoreductase [Actinomadura mexicana]